MNISKHFESFLFWASAANKKGARVLAQHPSALDKSCGGKNALKIATQQEEDECRGRGWNRTQERVVP